MLAARADAAAAAAYDVVIIFSLFFLTSSLWWHAVAEANGFVRNAQSGTHGLGSFRVTAVVKL